MFITLLRSYEKWISQIYVKAGLLDEVPRVDNPEVPRGINSTWPNKCTQGGYP